MGGPLKRDGWKRTLPREESGGGGPGRGQSGEKVQIPEDSLMNISRHKNQVTSTLMMRQTITITPKTPL